MSGLDLCLLMIRNIRPKSGILVILLTVILISPNPVITEADAVLSANSIYYEINTDAVKEDYESDSEIVLRTPDGNITIHANAVDLGNLSVYTGSDSTNATFVKNLTHVALHGYQEGYASESTAYLLIGDHAVYGTVDNPVTRYVFNSEFDSEVGRFLQNVTKTGTYPENSDAEAVALTAACEGQYGVESRVAMYVEPSFWNEDNYGNWEDRITSGFNKYLSLYCDLQIELKIEDILKLDNNVLRNESERECPYEDNNPSVTATSRFFEYVSQSYYSGVDAYQLWTGQDLWADAPWYLGPDGYWCFGLARSDSVHTDQYGREAVSVVEAVDVNCCDSYDPDEVHERGIISGHEFGHVYGEPEHPTACKDLGQLCNIMKRGEDIDDLSYWFTSGSKEEIKARFHGQKDPNSDDDVVT